VCLVVLPLLRIWQHLSPRLRCRLLLRHLQRFVVVSGLDLALQALWDGWWQVLALGGVVSVSLLFLCVAYLLRASEYISTSHALRGK